ncbi:Uncharacterized protein YhaN [Nitrosospira sp. Nsp14]|uniref:YhaN family protein n=1 Tax=Nitrosospira sp. Nsp14 TaxID=1855333 RepID=UPI0008EF9725|nr:YhaN family protein [Nitrosospira sp. Nsp14]SFH58226.1 Uncharacterized protein YhaN [Nitrosospira sp. Nsp14]
MRFQRLDLIRYGKFSDCSVDFPASTQDFHLIVGPNEAGKSTLRSAIVDLLFGMLHRSPMGFLHPLSELRLGAHISNKSGALEFHRIKAQKQSLRAPQNSALADTALNHFLGAADRNFFEQMFGLDHKKLVEGGNSILNAENDVGQVLFQAAAGVGSLGKVRDALLAEAEKLWAPRRSADRAYYIAAQQLEDANAALKQATVRTREWTETSRQSERLQEMIDNERARHGRLQGERNRLERIRRLAPLLRIFGETEKQLNALGGAAELPPDAASIFSAAEQDIAKDDLLLELGNGAIKKTEHDLAKIEMDEAVLAIAAEIKKLEELRLRYAAHEGDIVRRESEKSILWRDIRAACAQLGWQAGSAEIVAGRLPTLLVRRELGQLARDHSGLTETLRAAELAESAKLSEIKSLTDELARLQSREVSQALHAVLADVRRLGDPDAEMQKQQAALSRKSAALENALRELGQWRMPLSALTAIKLPGQNTISRLMQERQVFVADRRAVSKRRDELQMGIAHTELKISQLKKLHHIWTREEVIRARSERDDAWFEIKKGEVDLQQGAEKFEMALFRADEVSDIQLNNVEKATELQGLQHQLEREDQDLSAIENQHALLNEEIGKLDTEWADFMLGMCLPGLPLEESGEWFAKREAALAAGTIREEAEDEFLVLSTMVAELRARLTKELQEAGIQTDESGSLSTLGRQAEAFINSVNDADTQRKMLSAQLQTAQASVTALQRSSGNARAAMSRWTQAWSDALEKAALPTDSNVGTVEGALELIQDVEKKLKEMREIQANRIDTMRADLSQLATETHRLAVIGAPNIKGEPYVQVIQFLVRRLTAAQEAASETARLKKALCEAQEQVAKAEEAIKTAKASLQPLMERTGVRAHALLPEAIARSDEKRRLRGEVAKARINLLEAGDGLGLEQIERECDTADLPQIEVRLVQIDAELSETVTRQNELSAAHANSSRALAEIGGSDAAAKAEAQRQQAIARMSDVAERYVKVFTAGRLLRWSIERYREEKQGPLLARAGVLFSKFTLGSFQRLVVDFEQEPMSLEGLRSNGEPVGISGMSDGTRDQLYLALRLAALELHLEQSAPLPFIADDLFINYDNARSEAGLEALQALSEQTQVIFLTHHAHLVPSVQRVFGKRASIIRL